MLVTVQRLIGGLEILENPKFLKFYQTVEIVK